MIGVFGVSKTYEGRTPALVDVTLHIARGEMVFLTGPTGAGKSTLLRLLYGAERPDRGSILVNGCNVTRLAPRHLPFLRRSMGIVFQDFKLLAERTVFDNVALALYAVGTPWRRLRERVLEVLACVGLADKPQVRVRQLSGGEQQRVAIARALVNAPQLVLADEPTGNLDPAMTLEIMKLFATIHQQGTTVVIATHDRLLVRWLGYRSITLEAGRVVSA